MTIPLRLLGILLLAFLMAGTAAAQNDGTETDRGADPACGCETLARRGTYATHQS